MESRALGKGLAALIPDRINLAEEAAGPQPGVAMVKTSLIKDNSFQPRQNYAADSLNDLIQSIKEQGVLQPILVRESAGGFEVVAGERRLKAARALNLDEVPVVVKKFSDQEALVVALIENIQREDLNPLEEARSFRRLIDEFRFSQEQIAKSVSKDVSTISNTLRLLKLPEDIQAALFDGRISMGHARAMLAVEDPQEQRHVFEVTVAKGLSVREVESLIKTAIKTTSQRKKVRTSQSSPQLAALETALQEALGTKVRIQSQRKRGKIIVEYYSLEDLERILKIIKH